MTAYKRADEVIKDPGTRACSWIIETKATPDREHCEARREAHWSLLTVHSFILNSICFFDNKTQSENIQTILLWLRNHLTPPSLLAATKKRQEEPESLDSVDQLSFTFCLYVGHSTPAHPEIRAVPFFTRELFDQVSDCLFILTLTYVSFYTWLGGNLNM